VAFIEVFVLLRINTESLRRPGAAPAADCAEAEVRVEEVGRLGRCLRVESNRQ